MTVTRLPAVTSPSRIRVRVSLIHQNFPFLRKATDSDECCLFRRFCKISAVFRFWRPVLNTWPHRFDRFFGKGHAASTIFRREYAARGLGRIAAPNLPSPEPHVRGGICVQSHSAAIAQLGEEELPPDPYHVQHYSGHFSSASLFAP